MAISEATQSYVAICIDDAIAYWGLSGLVVIDQEVLHTYFINLYIYKRGFEI